MSVIENQGEAAHHDMHHALSRYVLPFIGRLGQVRLIAGGYFTFQSHAKATVDVEPAPGSVHPKSQRSFFDPGNGKCLTTTRIPISTFTSKA